MTAASHTRLLIFLIAILASPASQTAAAGLAEQLVFVSSSGSAISFHFTDGDFSYSIAASPPGVAMRIVVPGCRLGNGVERSVRDLTARIMSINILPGVDSITIDIAADRDVQLEVHRFGRTLQLDTERIAGGTLSGSTSSASPSIAAAHHEVIRLRYAGAAEIADALVANAQLATGDALPSVPPLVAGNLSGGLNGVAAAPNVPNERDALPAEHVSPNIAIDRRLNALIVSGSPDELREIEATVRELDTPVPSVMIDAEIVELTDDAARDLGIDFSSAGSLATASIAIHNLSAPSSAASFQAALYAQIQSNHGRVLARPRIATQSSVPAYIQTGDAIPVITAITYPGGSGVTQQQVQYVNVGVTLAIRPRVGPDGMVTVNMTATVSSVTGYVQSAPQVSERSVTAIASVRDEGTFVLGGLIQESDIRDASRFPILGSLPVIGRLFSIEHSSRQQTNLYITITPHIIETSGGS